MSTFLLWLPEVLRRADLKVALVAGWETRGRPGQPFGPIKGIICHRTGTADDRNMPTLNMLRDGRSDLQGPLAQLGLGRDGTYYVIAAGRANHAGAGNWRGITSGNTSFIGIEAENRGNGRDPWPAVQMEAYRRGVAAIFKHLGLPAEMCCGHKEYAPRRKPDPLFDMNEFRRDVDLILRGQARAPELIPTHEPEPTGHDQRRPTLRRGAKGDWVELMQEKLGVHVDGSFGPGTEAALRAFQRSQGMVPDGIAGPRTWAALDEPAHPIHLSGESTDAEQPTGSGLRVAADSAGWLGSLSAKYETGGRGAATVSSGHGDAGGVSYGSYQMTSKPNGGTVKDFVSRHDFKWKAEFAGLTPGTLAFKSCWQTIAAKDEKGFQAAQHEYIKRTHFDPLAERTKAHCNLDVTERSHALQNVVWSTAVQHGPFCKVIDNAFAAVKAAGMADPTRGVDFDRDLITAIYHERGRVNADQRMVYFSKNSLDVQRGVKQRFAAECKDALAMLAAE